jgi:hypothetical protein
MPTFDLLISAELENVKELRMPEAFAFRVIFECDGCATRSDKPQVFSRSDSAEVPGGRGEANLVAKCKGCGRQYNVEIVSSVAEAVYTADSSGKFARVASIECRGGITPVALEPGDGWTLVGNSGHAWSDQDLTEDWSEYDEDSAESLTLLTFQAKFEASKKR